MLDSKYRVDQLLAVGGMGAVYVGTHTKLRKRVAIKVLNPQVSSPLMVERFHREAVTASQIGHEGIVQVTDLGTSRDGEPFLVMELLEGESLAKRIKRTGAMPVDVACRIAVDILSPLEAAHRAGIVHRDLKPDNVFLVRQSRGEMVKLLDFGIARAAGHDAEFRLTTTGLVLGTPYYMSPEQARGENEVTHLADIYAVGVILYEMVCGQVPIQGENYNQLMFKVMSGDFRPPRELRPDLPRELELIILASLALEPKDRPRSAAALEQALLAFCGVAGPDRAANRAPGSFHAAASPSFATTLPSPVNQRAAAAAPPTKSGGRRWAIAGVAGLGVVGGIAALVVATSRTPVLTTPAGSDVAAVPSTATVPSEETPTPPDPSAGERTTHPTDDGLAVANPPGSAPAPTGASGNPSQITPAKPSTIKLRFSVIPSTARIYVDGRRVKDDELEVDKDDAKHQIRITAPGYASYEGAIAFDETQKLTVELARESKANSATRQTKTTPTEPRRSDKIESQSPYD